MGDDDSTSPDIAINNSVFRESGCVMQESGPALANTKMILVKIFSDVAFFASNTAAVKLPIMSNWNSLQWKPPNPTSHVNLCL